MSMLNLLELTLCLSLSPSPDSRTDNYLRRRGNGLRRRDYERHRDRRSRSGSYPIDRNALMNWDYDDYVQQVSRGLRPTFYPGLYEERVDAFLRGIGSRRGGRRSYSRSRTRSVSFSPHNYAQHSDWRGRSCSKSRSPSGEYHHRGRRFDDGGEDHYNRRPSAHYDVSPKRVGRSVSRSRSPRSFEQDDEYWRREPRTNHPVNMDRQRRPPSDGRFPRRRDISPRHTPTTSSRSAVPTRRHR
ncbi:uncharacterized protein DEA37_0014512 [Paragonimus westermani]|uniref:Uncharacterized protein n=1 Tax=Paragonimus westermani TaxID=34504 RepID=A0A5J4P1F8_9TREM|nr:uncharacterized protein DEA37_0014512 [Paragonimus westermani]